MLELLLNDYIFDPENPEKNYNLAVEYDNLGQTASALSFYLRAAERTSDKDLAYECLIRMGRCFDLQKNRKFSVKSMYHAAIALLPERPEAYYHLSKFLESETQYFESYTISEIGLNISKDKTFKPINVYYPGRYALLFQKATAAWWRGRGKESRQLYQELVDQYWNEMDQPHKNSTENNILKLGSSPPSYIYKMYKNSMYSKLRYKFKGSENIRENYSQIYQDLFVLSMLDGKRNGTFIEVGGAGPHKGNNTYLLEKDFDWKGVSIEYDENFVKEYRQARPSTTVLHNDALEVNYRKLIKDHFNSDIVDYLQLDIEPAGNTYECLKKIPFDEVKFRVITYEHDYYADMTRSFREKSREFLKSKGYVLVANDLSPDGVCTFEDWWVHPDTVSPEILLKMRKVIKETNDATEYMFPVKKTLDWGLIESNQWFKGELEREFFRENIYQRFVPIKQGDVVLDMGASIGIFPWILKDKNIGKIVCVEPHKELFKTMLNNVEGMDNVVCINKGIGSINGKEFQNGLFNENFVEEQEEANRAEIETITFKTLLQENNITHVNFLKLDCEGAEYDIFTDENIDWIKDNVDYIVGEFHITTDKFKERFKYLRDHLFPKFNDWKIFSIDHVDIKSTVNDEWFFTYYKNFNVYIDNRVKTKKRYTLIDNLQTTPVKKYIKDKWKYSITPTLEFTTIVPEKGCVVDCVFCPQRTLVQNYKGERRLSLANFKKVIDKLPKEIRITFSGFVEPWMNSDCTDMLMYAYEQGHPVAAFTTLVGVSINDLERLKHVKFAGQPNGAFTVHLPDQENRAKHPLTKKYLETVEHFSKIMHEFNQLDIMCMGTIHESVRHMFTNARVTEHTQMWSRAGNLIGERILKPELNDQTFYMVDHGPDKKMTCGCDERLYHNIMLPNGDVSLCCMDYGLEEITGNLFEQEYNDVIPDPYEVFKLCNKCENAIDVNSSFIKAERKMFDV